MHSWLIFVSFLGWDDDGNLWLWALTGAQISICNHVHFWSAKRWPGGEGMKTLLLVFFLPFISSLPPFLLCVKTSRSFTDGDTIKVGPVRQWNRTEGGDRIFSAEGDGWLGISTLTSDPQGHPLWNCHEVFGQSPGMIHAENMESGQKGWTDVVC